MICSQPNDQLVICKLCPRSCRLIESELTEIVLRMPNVPRIDDSEEARARARLLAHFEDHLEAVFYSRQLEVIFEREFFHWVTNRALRRLVEEAELLMKREACAWF